MSSGKRKVPKTTVSVSLPGKLPFKVALGTWWVPWVTFGHKMITPPKPGNVIYVTPGFLPSVKGVTHEYKHIEQWKRDGNAAESTFKYLWKQLTRGYKKHPYEVEAWEYAEIHQAEFQDWAAGQPF